MRTFLNAIIGTATFRQSSTTFTGTIFNGVLGALFYIVLARVLGPADFGLLTVSITTLTLIADIADFGTNTGLIKFVSSTITSNKDRAFRFLKLSLEIKLAVWTGVLVFGFLVSPLLAEFIFSKPELTLPLRLSMIGVGSALLFTFATSTFQSFQKYISWSVLNILTNLFRLLAIIVLVFTQQISLISGLLAYIIFPFLGFSISLLFIPTKSIFLAKEEYKLTKEFLNYNKWVGIFTLIAAVSARLDTFITASLLTARELGVYSAANQLTSVIPQLIGALGVVAAPKFSSFQSKKEMLTYFKKFQLMVLGLSGFGVLILPLAVYFIPIIYGIEYSQAVVPFIILVFSMLVFLVSVPLHSSIIFYFGKPEVFVWVSITHLLIVGTVGLYLISSFGIVGAALTVLIGMVFNLVAPLIWFLLKLKSNENLG